jgi:hypothetical protein
MRKSWFNDIPGMLYGSDAGTIPTRPLVGRVVVEVMLIADAIRFLDRKRAKILTVVIQDGEASAVCISFQVNRNLPQSAGHIRFAGEFEYFAREDAQVYRAPINAPILTDGCRSGRWESSRDHWERLGAGLVAQWADAADCVTPTGCVGNGTGQKPH